MSVWPRASALCSVRIHARMDVQERKHTSTENCRLELSQENSNRRYQEIARGQFERGKRELSSANLHCLHHDKREWVGGKRGGWKTEKRERFACRDGRQLSSFDICSKTVQYAAILNVLYKQKMGLACKRRPFRAVFNDVLENFADLFLCCKEARKRVRVFSICNIICTNLEKFSAVCLS